MLDGRDRPHYIARFVMDVLLFLSAILTALTGAITGVRAVERPQLAVSSVAPAAAKLVTERVGVMPSASFIPANVPVETVLRLDLTAKAPRIVALFADRRRE